MALRAKTGGGKASETKKTMALLFELESLVLKGRDHLFEAAKAILGKSRVKLDPVMFCRYFLEQDVSDSLSALMLDAGGKELSPGDTAELLSTVLSKTRESFVDSASKLDPGMNKLLEGARDRNVRVGFLCAHLDEASAKRVIEKLKIGQAGATLACARDNGRSPRINRWLKLSKDMGLSSLSCVAVSTSARFSKAALSAGMRCVVVCDSFTCYQDVGGVDYVFEELDGAAVKTILSIFE